MGLLCFSLASCLTAKQEKPAQPITKAAILDLCRQQSRETDPGKFGKLYENLPDGYAELCRLIKAQLIHPAADLPALRNLVPARRSQEDRQYPTVRSMLAALAAYNPKGLVLERVPAERLLVTCRYHSVLMASILRSKGVPVRVRYGFATYLVPNKYTSHVICEVWDSGQGRWVLIDPDRQRIDVTPKEFLTGGQAWLAFRKGDINPQSCGVDQYWGLTQMLTMFCLDLRSVQGNAQRLYWEFPPLITSPNMKATDVPESRAKILDKAAKLLLEPDDNWDSLQSLYKGNYYLRF
jgi:hypothetical protein